MDPACPKACDAQDSHEVRKRYAGNLLDLAATLMELSTTKVGISISVIKELAIVCIKKCYSSLHTFHASLHPSARVWNCGSLGTASNLCSMYHGNISALSFTMDVLAWQCYIYHREMSVLWKLVSIYLSLTYFSLQSSYYRKVRWLMVDI